VHVPCECDVEWVRKQSAYYPTTRQERGAA
jgi:hypothetical protein